MIQENNRIKIEKLTDLLPYINEGISLAEIGRRLVPKRKPNTMYKYAKLLREAGHTLPTQVGRRKLKI